MTMPTYKPKKSSFPEATANFPNATTAPGSTSVWGGPVGSGPVHPRYIPPKSAKNR